MIQPNELRLDNWMYKGRDSANMSLIQLTEKDLGCFSKKASLYHPVQLNMKWVAKFGLSESFDLLGLKCTLEKHGFEWLVIVEDADCCIAVLKYVHHLQNWWSATIKTELELKEQTA